MSTTDNAPDNGGVSPRPGAELVIGSGHMAELIRTHDWAATELGALDTWPTELMGAVNLMLGLHVPCHLYIGANFISVYNDAFIHVLGTVHPRLFAISPRRTPFWENKVKPALDEVLKGKTMSMANDRFDVLRDGYVEEAYYTYSLSPVYNCRKEIIAIYDTCFDTTSHVLAERRLLCLRDLGYKTTIGSKSLQETLQICCNVIADSPDTPYNIIYMLSENKRKLQLKACANISMDHPQMVHEVSMSIDLELASNFQRRLISVMLERKSFTIADIHKQTSQPVNMIVNGKETTDMITTIMMVPVVSNEESENHGVLVVACNPHLPLNDAYKVHIELVSRQVANAINTAKSFEAERSRAESLAKLDKAKTDFFSNVSHEFRMPLTLISSPLNEILRDSSIQMTEGFRQRLELIQRNSTRLMKLVNSLLEFNRAEAGGVQPMFVPVDLGSVTSELASVFRSVIEEVGLQLNVEIEDMGEPVYIDRDMWEKILYNLLSNAFKFTLQGSITVKLSRSMMAIYEGDATSSFEYGGSAESAQAGAATPMIGRDRTISRTQSAVVAAVLSVSDTGCGVAKEELGRLFERFHRVEASKGRSFEGTGIGLALTQELVKLHGGHIVVKSAPGEGTVFRIYIPLGYDHLPADRVVVDTARNNTKDTSMDRRSSPLAQPFIDEARRWIVPSPLGHGSTADGDNMSTSPLMQQQQSLYHSDDSVSLSRSNFNLAESMLEEEEMEKGENDADKDDQFSGTPISKLSGDVVIQWNGKTPTLRTAALLTLQPAESEHEDDDDDDESIVTKAFSDSQTLLHQQLSANSNSTSSHNNTRPLVLIVDDNVDMREYLNSLLVAKYRVVAALDGQDALDKLQWLLRTDLGLPRVIISDVMMPRVDGFQLIKQVHAHEKFKAIPVILLSARAGEEARVEGLQSGADDYLTKPFASKELMARVQTQVQVGLFRIQLERMVAKRTKALVESEKQYRILSQMSPVGIYRCDELGRMVYANARFIDIVGIEGMDVDALINWDKFVHEEDRPLANKSKLHKTASETVETRLVSPRDGRTIWVYKHSMMDVDATTGEIRGTVSVLDDITQLKVLQEERLQALARAEQEAKKRAADADEHRRQQELFVDMVCHEIRNPLNGIVNTVDIFQTNIENRRKFISSMEPSDTRTVLLSFMSDDISLVKSIDICTNHQRKIADDVLNLSKLSSGNVLLCLEPVHPAQLITVLCDMFTSQTLFNSVKLVKVVPAAPHDVLCVQADPYRLSQIIINLISNAIKFTTNCPERTVTVRLSYDLETTPKGTVMMRVSVQDTGVGMSDQEVASLFQRFRQANLKTYSRYGGTGLGLYISKMMLDLMSGHILVESKPHQGSTFTLSVPCELATSPSSESREALVVNTTTSTHYLRALTHINPPSSTVGSGPVSPMSSSSGSFPVADNGKGPLLILVVEDNDINQRILKRQLETATVFSCKVTLAENGAQAVQRYQEGLFDVILMDVEMPVMDGLEATKRIRAHEIEVQLERVPIIGLSGNARDFHVTKGIEAGMDDYLSKPYGKDELMRVISRVLKSKSQRSSNSSIASIGTLAST